MAEAVRGWRDVRIGALVVGALTLAILASWIQRSRNPFEEGYVLNVYVEDAHGLEEGAPVTLSGLRVGEVHEIQVLRPAARKRLQPSGAGGGEELNIRVVLGIVERHRGEITVRSQARLASAGLSGTRYIRIDKGPVVGEPLQSGDRLRIAPSIDAEIMLARGSEIVHRIESLNRNSAEVGAKLRGGGGTVGRLVANPADNEVAENFEDLNTRAARVMRLLEGGPGTLGLERRTRAIRSNLERFQTTLASIRSKATQGGGSLGSFASDPELPRALGRLERRVGAVNAKLERADGSLGRFVNDPEILDQLESLTAVLDSLTVQVMEDPLGSIDVDLR